MLHFQQQKSLKDLCTFGIGGTAKYFCEIKTVPQMQFALKHCSEQKWPFYILGKGSNCLFSDKGFDGAIIHNKIDFFSQEKPGLFHVGAGYSFSLLGVQTAKQGWSGLEFASGIPASVGGAIFMNAGASGAETCDTLQDVDFVDSKGELFLLTKEQLQFGYRHSTFHSMQGAIVGAKFQLSPSSTAREKQFEIIRYRTSTQPYGHKSAGCVFRNPSNNHAGALIEASGLKGFTIGGATVSPLHANFIVNDDDATASDVLELIKYIKAKVLKEKGMKLESEIRIVPYCLGDFS